MKQIDINTPIMNRASLQSSFFGFPKSTCFLLGLMLILHLLWASQWPLLNDESYYWDWARNMQLSYVDAPPAISWVAYIGSAFARGIFGARLIVPILNFFSAIFLIKSAEILSRDSTVAKSLSTESSLIVILLFSAIPIFNMNGILLMPDAPLLFACAGSLYFALKSCENCVYENKTHLSLVHGLFLGFFLGLGIVSKYQAVPFAIGIFLAIVCLRGFKTTIQKDILFWTTTIALALLVASPLFIWNLQNNFASFKFQGQHGFSTWNLNIINFIIYMVSVLGILLPWYSYLFIKQTVHSLQRKIFFQSLDCIPLFAFFSIFIFIGSAALGKPTQVHWITPSVLFLIPLVAANWDGLTNKRPNFWKDISIFSLLCTICLSTFIFTRPVQTFFSQDKKIFGFSLRQIHKGLYGNLLWSNLGNPETNFQEHIPEIALIEKKYFKNLDSVKCIQEPYLAGFNWRWTSQFAFYLKNQPRIFSFDLNRTTYYSWRDYLPNIAGCHFFILGPKSMYHSEEIRKIMNIQSTKEFNIPQDYTDLPIEMILVEGRMKDADTLREVSLSLLQNARY